MKAILLAAGAGTRLLPFTANKSKALVEVGGISLIDHIVYSLKENGINRLTIVTGCFASQLEEHLLNKHKDILFNFIFNKEYLNKNNIISLYIGLKNTVLDDDIILIETDLIFDKEAIKSLVNNPSQNIAVIAKYLNWMDGSVVSIKDGAVSKFFMKKEQVVDFSYEHKYKTVNIYKLSKETCKNLLLPYLKLETKKNPKNYYESAFKNLVELNKLRFTAYVLDKERWYEIDDPVDLKVAEYIFDSEKAYDQMANAFGGYWLYNVMDFSLLTNFYFPTEYMVNQLRSDLETLLKNYNSKQEILDEKLSHVLGVNKSKIIFLNGLSQIYPLLSERFSDKKVLIPKPTFGEYRRNFPNSFSYNDDFGVNLDTFEKTAKNADVIFFINPNNPTGTYIEENFIYNFASNNKDKIVLVDESYIDFSNKPSLITKLEKNPLDNLIVLKSLSKCLGAPGLRIGFIYTTNKEFLTYITKKLPIWGVNSIAERYIELLLKHKSELNTSIIKTLEAKQVLIRDLRSIREINVIYNTFTNFVVIKIKKDSIDKNALLHNLLVDYRILIKDVTSKFEDGNDYFRIAVRTIEDNDYFIKCFKKVLQYAKRR